MESLGLVAVSYLLLCGVMWHLGGRGALILALALIPLAAIYIAIERTFGSYWTWLLTIPVFIGAIRFYRWEQRRTLEDDAD